MSKTGVVISEKYSNHKTGLGHPECPERISVIKKTLEKTKILNNSKIKLYEPLIALITDIQLIHPTEYISKIKEFCESGGGPIGMDTIASKATYNTALLAAGGGLTALNKVLEGEVENAFAFIRPPGHHAGFSSARGFCFFNN
ncbi:MAG: histone deacetylase, partial [Candidatus Odinarchaeia archaeon]